VCNVGDEGPGGGKVFYYSATAFTSTGSTCNTNCHYLEAAPSDQSTGIVWATTDAMCWNSSSNDNNCQEFSIYSPYDTPNQSDSRTAAVAIGKGMSNTNKAHMLMTGTGQAPTSSYASGIAWAYANNSKTDWFLPSKDELNELCKYARNTGQASGGEIECTGGSSPSSRGFASSNYWSSSEMDGNFDSAWYQNFSVWQSDGMKVNAMYVRPVRAF